MITKDDKFERVATFTVTKYDEETETVTGINDRGAEVIMQKSLLESIYVEATDE